MPALVVKIPVTQGDLEYIAHYVTAELIYRWSLNITCEQEAVNVVMDFIGLDVADLTAAIASNKNFIKIVGDAVKHGGRAAATIPLCTSTLDTSLKC